MEKFIISKNLNIQDEWFINTVKNNFKKDNYVRSKGSNIMIVLLLTDRFKTEYTEIDKNNTTNIFQIGDKYYFEILSEGKPLNSEYVKVWCKTEDNSMWEIFDYQVYLSEKYQLPPLTWAFKVLENYKYSIIKEYQKELAKSILYWHSMVYIGDSLNVIPVSPGLNVSHDNYGSYISCAIPIKSQIPQFEKIDVLVKEYKDKPESKMIEFWKNVKKRKS